MVILKFLLKVVIFLSLIWSNFEAGTHEPSNERGDSNYRRKTNIDVNKVRATTFNYGLVGRTGNIEGEIPFEWPVNSGHYYVAMAALAVGAEYVSDDGSIVKMVTVNGRQDNSGNSKGWEPVPGYLNSASSDIAISDNNSSWPLIWPDKMNDTSDPGWSGAWNGYFGKNQLNAEQEIFYKISDDRNYTEGYSYIPDSTDINRGGLGLLASVRVLEWKQILIEDVVFLLHDVKNDGTKDLEKVAFSLWYADFVGGDGNDDELEFDILTDVAWSYDTDGIGSWGNSPEPGYIAVSYIETPGNAVDRIDNDGDGEENGPTITESMLEDEILGDAIDNNGNGLIDENLSHVAFAGQLGVTFSDRIDNDVDGEINSPIVTQEMVDSVSDQWGIWPSLDSTQAGKIHIIQLDLGDIGSAYADGIDNDADIESPYAQEYPFGFGSDVNGPLITQQIIDEAVGDIWGRYSVPNSNIILYNVGPEDLGKPYADGVDNDGDGAIDEGIDENIDEMIDESRDDFIDNDGDWSLDNDSGLYGDSSGGINLGVNDQMPTSGSGTTFQGEPNIDKTDVSESDQMGLTAVSYTSGGSVPLNQDNNFWNSFMRPGLFNTPVIPGDNDLFVSSGYFPLKAGQTERIAMAISIGNDKADALQNTLNAQTAYDFDYRFAKAPSPPNVSVVAGDGQVTLYWDSSSESSYDTFMEKIGSDPRDFEGYKIYRATDLEFNDAFTITDGDGNPTFYKPYSLDGETCQWDLDNGINGWHPVDLNGVHFYLGDDTGLKHSFVDTDVVNGQTYYYAVVAYDFGGDEDSDIMPTDSPMRLRVNSLTGELDLGPNVVSVIPVEPVSGYIEADMLDDIPITFGQSNGSIQYEVIDPLALNSEKLYEISFSDSANYSLGYFLTDISNIDYPDTLIYNYSLSKSYQPVIDGFRLLFSNVSMNQINLIDSLSYWNRHDLWDFIFENRDAFTVGDAIPANYRIIFTETENLTQCYCSEWLNPNLDPCSDNAPTAWCSTTLYESNILNVIIEKQIYDELENEFVWESIPFAFGDYAPYNQNTNSTSPDGIFNADERETDYLILLDSEEGGRLRQTWSFSLDFPGINSDLYGCCNEPQIGDTAHIVINKPFLSTDYYEFSPSSPSIDNKLAQSELDDIYVVPNPYFATVPWEGKNTFSSGRGPREIQFRNLPQNCTIRIYSIAGEIVNTIEHNSYINNGMEPWDLLTKDNLAAAYGIYIYHVDAPDIGEFVGKFAIVK